MTHPQTIAEDIDGIDYAGFSVDGDFIDANGHMNVGYYSLLFDSALERPWGRLGIGADNMRAAGKGSFALEAHFTYQREVVAGDPLGFWFQMLDYDAKRLHYFMTMTHADAGWTAAIGEQISMCVDLDARRGTTWPDDVLARLSALYDVHRHRPRPTEIGHVIGIRRRS